MIGIEVKYKSLYHFFSKFYKIILIDSFSFQFSYNHPPKKNKDENKNKNKKPTSKIDKKLILN